MVSDWGAQYPGSGVSSALAGLDIVMPGPNLWGGNLTKAVRNGTAPESRVTDMAAR